MSSFSTPPSTPVKKRRTNSIFSIDHKFSITDLDDTYYAQLVSAIPILENGDLLQDVLNYCYIMMNRKKENNRQECINILRKINRTLERLKNLVEGNIKLNIRNKKNNVVITSNNANHFYKSDTISAVSLIEAIIAFTYHYYFPHYSPSISLNNNKNHNDYFKQTMNKIDGITLGIYIFEHMNDENFEKKFLKILEKVVNILINSQNNALFIHGDLHPGNIMISMDGKNIRIIDFGHSTIRLPTKDNKKILLSAAVDSNINRKYQLDISEDTVLKCIDLMHFIGSIYSVISEIPESKFKNIIKKLYELSLLNRKINLMKLHKVRQNYNMSIFKNADNTLQSILYPEKLLELIKNNNSINRFIINLNDSTCSKRSSNGICVNNEPQSKKKGLFFNNNSNNNKNL
jgi:thiamine kinase-like enzyme